MIEENALRNWIDNFYGYGSWHARFWFVDHEETGGDVPEEVAEKIVELCLPSCTETGMLYDYPAKKFLRFVSPA